MSFDKTKTDPELGQRVYNHLRSLGLEEATTDLLYVSNKEKIEKIEHHMTEVYKTLGYDLTNDSLYETPKRIAKMMVLEQCWGLLFENFPKCTTTENRKPGGQMVMCEGIQVMSVCQHHHVTIDGICSVAYIPKNKVLGLSKLNRIVEYYSRRATIQENLTNQIFEAVKFITETEDVAVAMNAKHYCVASRGVGDSGSRTNTSALGGAFMSSPDVRAEFYSLHNSKLVGIK